MNENLFDLTGKIGVVTGAARGLGQAAAVGLAAYGTDIAAMNYRGSISIALGLWCIAICSPAQDVQRNVGLLEEQFQELPMESRRLIGPLFWLHGDESPHRLEMYVGKVAEGGNGCFITESRPHSDWLGPGWYRDLAICLEAARRHGRWNR